jgi:predicted DNA-binding protein (MmcQ/YjbR family)
MTYEDINNYCMAKIGAFMDTPFGPFPICYKVGNRIFLEWYPEGKLTLRCEPVLSDYYRRSYPGVVIVGYHCPDRQKPYKNTVYLDRGLDERIIWDMIDISYEEAVKRLRKQDREKLIDLEMDNVEKSNKAKE